MARPAVASTSGVGRWRGRWLPGPAWIGREAVEGLFATQRRLDPFGHRLHTAAGVAACFGAGWPTTVLEWSPLLLLVVFVVRMTEHHRVLRPLWGDPVALLTALYVAWVAVSAGWTAGSGGEWLDEFAPLRYALLPLLLYPVLDRRGWLVGGLIAGVLCGNASQVVQGVSAAMESMGGWGGALSPWVRLPGRVSGWWDPVVGGSVLCAALGLHVGAAATGRRGGERTVGAMLAVVTACAVAATGTRGAWIAGAVVVAAGVALATRRWGDGGDGGGGERRGRGWAWIAGVVVVLASVSAVVGLWGPLRARAERGIAEARAAVVESRYDTDTGARLGMWRWAWSAAAEHPVRGVGAGGYRSWIDGAQRRGESGRGPTAAEGFGAHAHAHSWWLHTLATLGMVGCGLLVVQVAAGVVGGVGERGERWGAGPGLGLVGLAAAGAFDTIGVTQATACWWMVLTALCLWTRPKAAVGWAG